MFRPNRWFSNSVCLLFLLIVGCFPIELDVSKDGRLLIAREEGFFVLASGTGKCEQVSGTELGQPVFARWAPSEKEFLAVTKVRARFDDEFAFTMVPLDGGQPRKLTQLQNAAYVRISPDGRQMLISTISERDDPELKDKVPQLHLVSTQDGKLKTLLKRSGAIVRWLGDSNRAIVTSIEKKFGDNLQGHLGILEIESGKFTKIASVIVDRFSNFDLSSDGQNLAIVCKAAGKPGTQFLEDDIGYSQKLFLATIDGTVTSTEIEADFAILSPSGKQVLLGLDTEEISIETKRIAIANLDALTEVVTLDEKAFVLRSFSSSGMYPGWISE